MKARNYLRIQLVQILHKLRIMAKPINTSFIPYLLLLQLVIASTLAEQLNSGNGTTKVLDTFTKQVCMFWIRVRLINGQIFDEDYFDHLISEIQEIRASERRFIRKSRTSIPLPLTIPLIVKLPKISLQQYKIRCTMPFMVIPQQRSL